MSVSLAVIPAAGPKLRSHLSKTDEIIRRTRHDYRMEIYYFGNDIIDPDLSIQLWFIPDNLTIKIKRILIVTMFERYR